MKLIDTENTRVVTRGEEGERKGELDKGSQIYGDGRKLDFWW